MRDSILAVLILVVSLGVAAWAVVDVLWEAIWNLVNGVNCG